MHGGRTARPALVVARAAGRGADRPAGVLPRPGGRRLSRTGAAFGFFTVTAGLNVLAVRPTFAEHPVPAAVAALAAVWLLAYGVPASALLTWTRGSLLGGVNGGWLLWIVATHDLGRRRRVGAGLRGVHRPAHPLAAETRAIIPFWNPGLDLTRRPGRPSSG